MTSPSMEGTGGEVFAGASGVLHVADQVARGLFFLRAVERSLEVGWAIGRFRPSPCVRRRPPVYRKVLEG